MKFIIGILFAASLFAQSYTLTSSGTLVATGGDQTSCTVVKNAGSTPSISISCLPGQSGFTYGPATLNIASGKSSASTFQVGDILCMIGMNATSAGVSMGSLGSVQPSSAVLSCSVNLRSAGPTTAITGNAVVPNQTIVWP